MNSVNSESSTSIKANAPSVMTPFNKTISRSTFKPSVKFEKRPCSEISFKDFLDFLRTAYQINEAIDGVPDDLVDKLEIDWQDVAMNEFVSSFLAVKDEKAKEIPEKEIKSDCKSISCISDSNLERTSKETTEITSELSEQTEDNSSKSSLSNSMLSYETDLQKDNIITQVDLRNNLDDVKKPCNVLPLDQQKNVAKTLLSTKQIENRRKLLTNKKDVMVENKAKKVVEDSNKSLEHMVKRKLNEVIQEGLLDSVLPYVVPKQPSAHAAAKKINSDIKKPPSLGSLDKSSSGQFSKEKLSLNNRRKSSAGEIEVEIHVCDEVKNLKRDFRCPQKLLVSKMGYFAEVTTGQKLEDMDISVHCDITIFDWLMRWVKRDSMPEENWPKLDAGNVVPILVSAAFLQMDPLLQDCLTFCRQHMNEIAKTSTNLACLNDSILTRLANLFSNSDVEALRDKKDKIQSRLYCKLIMALTETSPEPARGHYASLASVYKCGKCDKLVLRQLGGSIPCKPCNMKMDRFGNIHGNHVRDQNWNINDYIKGLRQELKSWRNVYWHLWGDCHFLYCSVCQNYFPVHQMKWCCNHPEPAQFFTMEHQRTMTFPIGRYPCCGDRAYRFEVLSSQTGCQFKDHTPALNTPRDMEVHKLFLKHQALFVLEPPKLQFPERLTRLVSNRDSGRGENVNRDVLWWEGIELAPPRPRQGLLAKMWEMHQKKEQQRNAASRNNSSASSGTHSVGNRTVTPIVRTPAKKQTSVIEVASTGGSSGNAEADNSSSNDDSSSNESTSDSENSEESGHAPVRRITTKPRRIDPQYYTPSKNSDIGHSGEQELQVVFILKRVEVSNQWLPKLSVRSNQDNQREYEERAVHQMATLLTRRTCADSSSLYARNHSRSHGHHSHHGHSVWNNHIIPQGGIYVRLEHEWREANCHSHGCHNNANRSRSIGWGTSSRPRVRAPR